MKTEEEIKRKLDELTDKRNAMERGSISRQFANRILLALAWTIDMSDRNPADIASEN